MDEFEMDDDFIDEDGSADTEGEVYCPWCGEPNMVAVDPAGGGEQEYVEDCQVCCRPWTVHVTYDDEGNADITVEAQGDWDD